MACLHYQLDLILRALEIIEGRANDESRTVTQRVAYNSAASMIRYALDENEECLNQFDY